MRTELREDKGREKHTVDKRKKVKMKKPRMCIQWGGTRRLLSPSNRPCEIQDYFIIKFSP